jgi:hypothetical protein
MAWFGAAVLLFALSLSDTVLNWLSRTLGVEDSSFVLLMVAGVLFLFTFFRFSVQVSEIKDHNIQLAQKVSLLEWEVRRQSQQIERLKAPAEQDQNQSPRGASP